MFKTTLTQEILNIIDSYLELAFNPSRFLFNSLYGQKKKDQVRQCLIYLEKKGYIKRIKEAGDVYFSITPKGKEIIASRGLSVDMVDQKREWDNSWWIVVYDIEEKERKMRKLLQSKLEELELGQVQKSVWVTPWQDVADELMAFIREHYLVRDVLLFRSDDLGGFFQISVIYEAWQLKNIIRLYQRFIKKTEKYFRKRKMVSLEEQLREGNRLMVEYQSVLSEDPCLPKEVWPEDWPGSTAHALYRRVERSLKGLRLKLFLRFKR